MYKKTRNWRVDFQTVGVQPRTNTNLSSNSLCSLEGNGRSARKQRLDKQKQNIQEVLQLIFDVEEDGNDNVSVPDSWCTEEEHSEGIDPSHCVVVQLELKIA